MAIKMTGASFKAWYNDDWGKDGNGDDPYIEEELIIVDGIEYRDSVELSKVSDDSQVTLDGGVITFGFGSDHESVKAESHYRKWLKAQNTITLLVEVSRDSEPEPRAAIKAIKGAKIP